MRKLLGTSNNARFRAISALAERAVAAARARVCPGSGTALMPDGDARSFAGSHTDSTPERAQAGAAAIRSSYIEIGPSSNSRRMGLGASLSVDVLMQRISLCPG